MDSRLMVERVHRCSYIPNMGTFMSMHHTETQAFNVQQISANDIIQCTDDLMERVFLQIVVSFIIVSECLIDDSALYTFLKLRCRWPSLHETFLCHRP